MAVGGEHYAPFPVVLDGGLAVPCNPKPAQAGSKRDLSPSRCKLSSVCPVVMKVGSDDGHPCEPRQDRKVATVNSATPSRRGAWLELSTPEPFHWVGEVPGTTGKCLNISL